MPGRVCARAFHCYIVIKKTNTYFVWIWTITFWGSAAAFGFAFFLGGSFEELEELEELEEQESEEERGEDELTSEDDLEKIEDDALIKEAGFIALDLIDTATPIASTN